MSNFVVSARKYRPIRFQDVVGQEHVTQTLKNALQNDHLAHAFLFCGPRGVGKTTCARILAKVLNCQNVTDDFEPCGTCSSCQSFNENASFNITELDAASNNSVEHIRALIEQVRFQPQQGEYKVFIIDEVHMLSQQAFNAFLKTLEEPPPYAVFILATTEKHKIIPTILSRCQIFDFKRIQVPRMVEHLQGICEEENIQADTDALHIIGQKADGALRDALSIFDRIVSFSGSTINYQDVITNLNVLDYDYYFRIIDAFLTEDFAQIMNTFDTILRNGFEPDVFLAGLSEHIRNLLVCKDAATLQLLEVSNNLKEQYHQQAQLAPASLLLTALSLANDCDVNYKMARNKRLHVEIALIKMTYINRAIQQVNQPSSPEKKNLISRSSAPPSKSSDNQALPSKPVEAPTAVEAPTVVEVSTVEVEAAPTQSASNHKLRNSKKYGTMQLKGLDALTAEVAEEQAIEIGTPTVEITQAKVVETWMTYAEGDVKSSVKSVLKNTDLKLEEEKITALVSSKLAENLLRQEQGLLETLRQNFQRPTLSLEIKIDATKIANKQQVKKKKLLTPKETFQNMVAVNPLVKDLVERFDLTLDD